MKNTILDAFDFSVQKFPNNIAISDGNKNTTYQTLQKMAKSVATTLLPMNQFRKAILVYIDKSVECVASMLGVLYSGNFYVVIDTTMPNERIQSIVENLGTNSVITKKNNTLPMALADLKNICYFEDCNTIDEDSLQLVRSRIISVDPAYALFTSGSTGVPKGCIVTHSNVISYIDWFGKAFNIDETNVFASQTPFYFSMSVSDLYGTLFSGAKIVLIPKMLFMFPTTLLEFLIKNKVNSIYWVPSALNIVANTNAFDFVEPMDLQLVLFAGEVMQVHQLNIWRKNIPNAIYANLFGPTETTDICTYYIVNRDFEESQSIPIGKSCENCDSFAINESGNIISGNEEGELYVRSSFVAPGYYNFNEKTKEVFVQNPTHNLFPDIVYRTGDIVKFNKYGEYEYVGRRDFQIKHSGYRIELGEIEAAVSSIEGVLANCCCYDSNEDKLVLFYQGESVEDFVREEITNRLLSYMIPEKIIKIDQMPYNANGKIDRKELKNNYILEAEE